MAAKRSPSLKLILCLLVALVIVKAQSPGRGTSVETDGSTVISRSISVGGSRASASSSASTSDGERSGTARADNDEGTTETTFDSGDAEEGSSDTSPSDTVEGSDEEGETEENIDENEDPDNGAAGVSPAWLLMTSVCASILLLASLV